MTNTRAFKWIELLLLFVAIPLILALTIPAWIKVSLVAIGAVWLLVQSKTNSIFKGTFSKDAFSSQDRKRITIIAAIILVGGSLFLHYYDASLLFKVVREKPLLWLIILFVYTFLSVVPQEFVYRRFFFSRYFDLFKDEKYLFALNVFCFSFCHLFLLNGWVLVLTALGGILFAYSYKSTNNLTLVSLEHALYGNLIFTIGLGEMLAFPG